MRENISIKKLGEVSDFQNGFAFKSKTFKESGVPVIRIGDIQNERVDTSRIVYVNPEDYKKDLSSYFISKGDLLIAMSGATTGKIGFVEEDQRFLLNQRVGKFKTKDNLSKKYLFYYLSTKVEESLKISAGSAQPNLSTKQIKDFKIPIPPLPEQKRIVAILDEAFEAIDQAKANIERNIQNAEELFQSKLNEIFSQRGEGWEEKRLGEISDEANNIKWEEIDGERKYIDLSSVSRDSLTITETEIINKINAPSRAKKIVKEDDVLFGTTRPTLKRVTIINEEYKDQVCSTGFYVIRPKRDFITAEWVFLFLQTKGFMDRMEKIQSGASYPAVNYSDMKNSVIGFPVSIDEQQRYSVQLFVLQKEKTILIETYKTKLESLVELKKSILQKAFSGELTEELESGLVGLKDEQDGLGDVDDVVNIAAEDGELYKAS